MNLLRAVTAVGGFTMLSRILGFVRDMLLAAVLGANWMADALFLAFKFPNLFRRLFAEGAFSAAFIPLFAAKLKESGQSGARDFAARTFSVLALALTLFVIAVEIIMPWIMHVFAPGFLDDPETFDLTVVLARIMFPYLIFISLVSLASAVLNALGHFAAAAATPVLLNIVVIGSLLVLVPHMPSPAHAFAWGISGAGVVQLLWVLWALARENTVLSMLPPKFTEDIKVLCLRALPVAVGAGIYQLNIVIDGIIASFLPDGSISYLFYADRVNQFPLGIVGVAVGTALLPMLSRVLKSGDETAAHHAQNRALEFSLLLTLPAAVALFVIAKPVIIVLFERGEFSPAASLATSQALAVYAIGLPAYVLVKALSPGFFAREDTKTPVVASVIAMTVNVVLSLILMGPFLHVGIAIATVVSAWLNACMLGFILYRRGHLILDERLCGRFPRVIIASAVMGTGLIFGLDMLEPGFTEGLGSRVAGLAALVVGGLSIFMVAALLLRAARFSDLQALKKPNR